MPGINKPSVPAARGGQVAKPVVPTEGFVQFSFKYAHLPSEGKFCINTREAEYFVRLVTRMREVSAMPTGDFLSKYSKALRNHSISFTETSEPEGFSCLNATLRHETMGSARQFSIDRTECGRIHGFMVGDVFFVVWYDSEHELYPRK